MKPDSTWATQILGWVTNHKTQVCNWLNQIRVIRWVNLKPPIITQVRPNFFCFTFFNKSKKYKINLLILRLTYVFIAYIHMNYFLIFQCEIRIYSLYPYELFFNFLIWDNYIYSQHSHKLYKLFLKYLIWDKYFILHFFLCSLHMNYFLVFQYNYTTLYIFLFIIYI
jgi:hypothetical protein